MTFRKFYLIIVTILICTILLALGDALLCALVYLALWLLRSQFAYLIASILMVFLLCIELGVLIPATIHNVLKGDDTDGT